MSETGTCPADAGTDRDWMALALQEAEAGARAGEVPVGAVLVQDGVCLARTHNAPIARHDPTAHAEIRVIRQAARILGNYRLPGTTLYVTLEPCPMCVGAMIHARIARLVFGAPDPRTGAAGSALDLVSHPSHNHRIAVTGGVLAEQAGEQLRAFFRERRRT
ncbi:tRNA-specific adenosine-34 deaminase [Thioalkalivibrio nitratireducens DSM 14787]|uniref:tRNA-specific adenosine deaminase n=1 Tax=Thioalkalivibrio nitratireducens (strain DSM 14787 / UNIQEM 213 / ALEN2) TaxID=1255043 RepID=L0DTJ6_THIND|nr:tRNA adenosine(34) deaminase TadA [Thioalkalivibrio nitratireducens]AGA32909.1 tRNA-specific adenosine-34 deaminase [Thioalkalivibrio nitratireducens DSM 14787]